MPDKMTSAEFQAAMAERAARRTKLYDALYRLFQFYGICNVVDMTIDIIDEVHCNETNESGWAHGNLVQSMGKAMQEYEKELRQGNYSDVIPF